MKVLHVINNLAGGGAERLLINFLQNIDNTDNDTFKIITLVDNKIDYEVTGLDIIPLTSKSKRFSFHKLYELYKFINKEKFDIVHCHLFPTQYYVAILRIFISKKTIFLTTEHNTTNKRRNFFIFRFIDKLMYRAFEKIIFISEGAKEQFSLDYHSIKQLIVIPNAIPITSFASDSIQIKNLNTKIKLLMVARFSEQKDQMTVIKTIELLDSKFTLTFVGDGPKKNYCIDYVTKRNLQDRISFVDFTADIVSIYKNHDIFVLSSFWEGFGLVVIEAMAVGLPVIASDVDGLREVVDDAGLLFEVSNSNDLKNKIIEVANDNKLYDSLVIKGKKHIIKYDISKYIKNHLELYNTILRK